jgi:hypothetical protein
MRESVYLEEHMSTRKINVVAERSLANLEIHNSLQKTSTNLPFLFSVTSISFASFLLLPAMLEQIVVDVEIRFCLSRILFCAMYPDHFDVPRLAV